MGENSPNPVTLLRRDFFIIGGNDSVKTVFHIGHH
jgi:hypothetical protein